MGEVDAKAMDLQALQEKEKLLKIQPSILDNKQAIISHSQVVQAAAAEKSSTGSLKVTTDAFQKNTEWTVIALTCIKRSHAVAYLNGML